MTKKQTILDKMQGIQKDCDSLMVYANDLLHSKEPKQRALGHQILTSVVKIQTEQNAMLKELEAMGKQS